MLAPVALYHPVEKVIPYGPSCGVVVYDSICAGLG